MPETKTHPGGVYTSAAETLPNSSGPNDITSQIAASESVPYCADVLEQHGRILTPRLMLELVDHSHAAELTSLLSAASESMLGSWPFPLTVPAALERIERAIAQTNQHQALAYVFSDRATGRVAGWCGAVRWHEASDDIAMLTYWIGREFEGRGHVAEAVRAAGPHVLAWIGASRLGAGAYPYNDRSQRTMQRAGLTTPDGVRQLWSSTRGQNEPIICFVASRAEVMTWPSVPFSALDAVGSKVGDEITAARAA